MSAFNESDVRRQKPGQPTGGQFAEKERGASGLALAPAAQEEDELPEVIVNVTWQVWNDRDEAVDVGHDSFDIAPLIAETPVDRRITEFGSPEEPGSLDYWVERAQERGLLEKHDGPFYAHSSDLEELVRRQELEDVPTRREPKIIRGVPLSEPLSVEDVLAEADEDGFVTATVEAHLEDLMQAYSNGQGMGEDDDHDLLAARVSPLPPIDCSYRVTGVTESGSLLVDFTTNVRAAAEHYGYLDEEAQQAS